MQAYKYYTFNLMLLLLQRMLRKIVVVYYTSIPTVFTKVKDAIFATNTILLCCVAKVITATAMMIVSLLHMSIFSNRILLKTPH